MNDRTQVNQLLCANENSDPWSLPRTANYASAHPIDTLQAADISEEEFARRYVDRNRPCLLLGAAKHWPAYEKWSDPEYLKRTLPDSTIYVRSKPNVEYPYMAKKSIQKRLDEDDIAMHRSMGLHAYFDLIGRSAEHAVVFGVIKENEPLALMKDDIGGYPCLPEPSGSRLYPPHRALIYRESYTDWHYHAADETFMTQVVGTKDVLLLPPDPISWKAIWSVIYEQGCYYDFDAAKFPETQTLQPYRTVVGPGDALYIPVFWWHAVEALGNNFGITVATTFKSPVHVNADMRFPAARRLLRRHLFTKKSPMIMAGAVYAMLHRMRRQK